MQVYSKEAYAKINLSLNVIGKRPDGYHEVSMVMHRISLADTVSLSFTEAGGITITSDSLQIPLDEKNIAYRAAQLMIERFQIPKGMRIHIAKRIPVAGGLAGGSTDAAAVMYLINRACGLGLSKEELMRLALPLGADVPFCIFSRPALAEGIGEKLTEIHGLAPCKILIVNPCVEISTKAVYEAIDLCDDTSPAQNEKLITALSRGNNIEAFCYMKNAMQPVSSKMCPQITDIIDTLKKSGAQHAMMSGSGATCFGIFAPDANLKVLYHLFPGCVVRETEPHFED